MPPHYIEKVQAILTALQRLVGLIPLLVWSPYCTLTQWHKLRLPVPGHLPAVIIGTLMALALGQFGFSVETIGTAFHYTLADSWEMAFKCLARVCLEYSNAQGEIINWNFDKMALTCSLFSQHGIRCD